MLMLETCDCAQNYASIFYSVVLVVLNWCKNLLEATTVLLLAHRRTSGLGTHLVTLATL